MANNIYLELEFHLNHKILLGFSPGGRGGGGRNFKSPGGGGRGGGFGRGGGAKGRGGFGKSPGRGGGGGGRGGRGGRGGGMKGGKTVIVEPHRLPGVFVARGKEDALVTLNMVPGLAVYGEKRIVVEVS